MSRVLVNDLMQKNYVYFLTESPGHNFHPDFEPDLTPKKMLELGVFGGKYMTDCINEFPSDWFQYAKLSPNCKNIELNFFKVDASLSLSATIIVKTGPNISSSKAGIPGVTSERIVNG